MLQQNEKEKNTKTNPQNRCKCQADFLNSIKKTEINKITNVRMPLK